MSESQVIVARALTNRPPDQKHLVPMLERMRQHCGRLPETFSADSGYWSERNAAYCDANGSTRTSPQGAETATTPSSGGCR